MQEIKPELSIPAMPKAGIIIVGLTWLLVLLVVPVLAVNLDVYWLGLSAFVIIGAVASTFSLYRHAVAQGCFSGQVDSSVRASAYEQNGLSEHPASSLSVLHVFRQSSKEAQHFRYSGIKAFTLDCPATQRQATVMVLKAERSSRVFVRIPLTRCHSLAVRGSSTKAVDRAFDVIVNTEACFADHYTATCDRVSHHGGEISPKMAAVLLDNPHLYRQSSFEFDEYGNLVFSFVDPEFFDFSVEPYRLADAASIEASRNKRMVMPRLQRTMAFLDSLLQTVE